MGISFARGALTTAAILVVSYGASLGGQQPQTGLRHITPEDYYSFEFLSEPRLSPDGSLIAYVVQTSDRATGRSRSSIWVAPTTGEAVPWELTPGSWSSSSPRWSPDGRTLAFLSARDGVTSDHTAALPQVYVSAVRGGEARRLTNFNGGVTSCEWSPDGKRFVVSAYASTGEEKSRPGGTSRIGRHITRTVYRGPGPAPWPDNRRSHLWLVDVSTGATKQVTDGDDWDDRDPQWSPDASSIAFVSDRTGLSYDARGQEDVHVISLATGVLTRVSRHERAKHPRIPAPGVSSPRWSADGTQIAYIAAADYQSFPSIWLASARGESPPKQIRQDLDVHVTKLQWADQGRSLCFEAQSRGERHLFRVDTTDGQINPVTSGPRFISAADVGSGKVAYVARDFTRINDLYVADLSGANERKIAAPTASLWKELELADVERLRFKGAEGLEIDGFFVKPVGWSPEKSYPMVLVIHGGPSYMYGMDWEHELQLYAAKGWAVLYTNPRGSSGYGEKFQRAVKGDWGDKPSIDVLNGIDTVLRKFPWIDRGRLGVTGLSYGGYLTNWLVGHTDMFKAAVTVNGVVNHVSQDGTRFQPFPRFADFGGTLWESYDTYWNSSPLKHARTVKTPTLVLQSEHDFMVSLEQGQQWFRALKYFDVTTEMVVFPGANHFGLNSYAPAPGREPATVVESLQWRLYWFDRFLNGNDQSPTPGARPTRADDAKP